MTSRRVVQAPGASIYTESFGSPADPTILLIMGAGRQGLSWEEGFCELLVDGGRHVVRYDHRDTGRSTCFDFATQPYGVEQLAEDALAILDAYGVEKGHLVGASMGGIVAQAVSMSRPDRVRTLTLVMSTPSGAETAAASTGTFNGAAPALPQPTDAVIEAMTAIALATTPDEELEAEVGVARVLAGSVAPFDEVHYREIAMREIERATDIKARANHGAAVGTYPTRIGRLHEITAPTLVIHGTEDPILPLPHGEALASGIPGARMLAVEGMGHYLPRELWSQLAGAILQHTA